MSLKLLPAVVLSASLGIWTCGFILLHLFPRRLSIRYDRECSSAHSVDSTTVPSSLLKIYSLSMMYTLMCPMKQRASLFVQATMKSSLDFQTNWILGVFLWEVSRSYFYWGERAERTVALPTHFAETFLPKHPCCALRLLKGKTPLSVFISMRQSVRHLDCIGTPTVLCTPSTSLARHIT